MSNEWKVLAKDAIKDFCIRFPKKEVTLEMLRDYLESINIPPPRHPAAWGGLMTSLLNNWILLGGEYSEKYKAKIYRTNLPDVRFQVLNRDELYAADSLIKEFYK